MAGGLVRAYEGHRFVYLHLLCQGLECIGKALLLAQDYDKYRPLLRGAFGHDLEKLVAEVAKATGKAMVSAAATDDVKALNHFYKNHILRYGDLGDFRSDLDRVSGDALHRELVEGLTEWNRKFEGG